MMALFWIITCQTTGVTGTTMSRLKGDYGCKLLSKDSNRLGASLPWLVLLHSSHQYLCGYFSLVFWIYFYLPSWIRFLLVRIIFRYSFSHPLDLIYKYHGLFLSNISGMEPFLNTTGIITLVVATAITQFDNCNISWFHFHSHLSHCSPLST